MSMEICTNGTVRIDHKSTKIRVIQKREGTVVFHAGLGGLNYQEFRMPHDRYSLSHDTPKPRHATPDLAAKYPAPAGRAQFEVDIVALLAKHEWLL